jgi:hypothetical protein
MQGRRAKQNLRYASFGRTEIGFKTAVSSGNPVIVKEKDREE